MNEDADQYSDFFADARRPAPAERDRSFVAVRSVKRSLLAELQSAGGRGAARPEEVLARWPTDPRSDRDAASVLFEDYQQRLLRGEDPSREEYAERFPEHKDSLAGLFQKRDILASISEASSASTPTLALPAVGEELFGFRLRRPLGEGAFARVFLAEQADLAGRPVVLKVSDTDGDEPQTLAQMQHTNIVPIYSVHENTEAGLRAVCMPYFGGASLSRVLEKAWKGGVPPTRGEQLVRALAAVGAGTSQHGEEAEERESRGTEELKGAGAGKQKRKAAEIPTVVLSTRQSAVGSRQSVLSTQYSVLSTSSPVFDPLLPSPPTDQGPLAWLARHSYAQACVWLVAQLADGLHHAHQRGVCHRDIKPSNILLGADGQPMLLDFNLAHHISGPKAHASATLGGTVSYMAPEHLRALAARDPALARHVDQRSDVYSLGMVLFEMLAGHSPFQQSASYAPVPFVIEAMALERAKAAPSLRQLRPDLPWGLESILRKCLAPQQEDRYQQAADLAEDLRRFLDDLPLRHAPELSRAERLQKWLRRHPQVTSVGSIVTAAVVLLLVTGAALVGVRNHLARTQEELEATQSRERKQEFEKLKTRAYCLVNTTSDVRDNLPAGLSVLEKVLGLYGVLERADWQEHPAWQRLTAEEQRHLAEDVRELLLLLAWARVKSSPGAEGALHDALALLDRAEAIHGLPPSPALFRDRAGYLTQLRETEKAQAAARQAERLQPASPRDHYLLATAYIRGGQPDRYPRALQELDRAVQMRPDRPDYWTHMQRGICRLELKQYDLAAADFGVCVGVWPDFAWGHFNYGLALDSLGRKEQALACYSAALELDSQFLHACWNRGVIHLEQGCCEDALRDLRRAAALGRDDAAIHLALGKAYEKLGRPGDAERSFEALFERLPVEAETRAKLLCEYGFIIAQRVPHQAQEAFRQVLAVSPRHRIALYGMGLTAVEAGQVLQAVDHFSLALHYHPGHLDARSCRAVLFARLGNVVEASLEIERCRRQDPSRGATSYDTACVMALASQHRDYRGQSAECKELAAAYLREAFARGFGKDKAQGDPDLAGLRGFPKFEKLLKETKR